MAILLNRDQDLEMNRRPKFAGEVGNAASLAARMTKYIHFDLTAGPGGCAEYPYLKCSRWLKLHFQHHGGCDKSAYADPC